MNPNCIKIDQNNLQRPPLAGTNLSQLNQTLGQLNALERIEMALNHLPGQFALTSSFGIDAAVSLHLLNEVAPGIPVILIDTGYLFKETYQYVETLTERLKLNLQVYQSPISAARFEALHGQLWHQGLAGIEQYNQARKVEPLEAAFKALNINSWFTGVRRSQSAVRKKLPWVELKNKRHKIHPILDWTDRDMYQYLKQHGLPQHPLFERGYLTVGDTHSTRSIHEVTDPEQLRFFGLKRECGIHE